MKKYKVTIHEHVLWTVEVKAPDVERAREKADALRLSEDWAGWVLDESAGWTELGDTHEVQESNDNSN